MQEFKLIEQLKENIKNLRAELEDKEQALILLMRHSAPPTLQITAHHYNGMAKEYLSYSECVWDFLVMQNRFTHIKEVYPYINAAFALNDIELAAKKAKNAMETIKKNEEVVKYTVANRSEFTFWGFSDWLDSKGDILPGHEFDKNILKSLM